MSAELLLPDGSSPEAPQLVGRFEADGSGLCFAWAGSTITVRFQGTALAVDLDDAGQNRFSVIVDGQMQAHRRVPGKGLRTLELVSGLPPGEHTATLYRLTEPLVGETRLLGFRLPRGATLLPPPAPRGRRLEIVGDSISTGYGNEDPDPSHSYAPSTQNHYLTYGAIAARELDADLVTIAWSGKGILSNRGDKNDTELMPELWRRALPHRQGSRWDFRTPAPHAVIINLGSNDYAPEVADTSGFRDAYERFVEAVRQRYPEAFILCTLGPLLSDDAPDGHNALTTVRRVLATIATDRRRAGDRLIGALEYAPVQEDEGWGADYHPSLRTHQRMAATLAKQLRNQLGWS